jgi:O-antigen/teichoic acid export membrane protein
MKSHRRFVTNIAANLGRGSASAAVALLLPPILVRHMTPASYAVWVLVLQTAAYVSYLNFGLQTAIGRYVAYYNRTEELSRRDAIFSTAFAALCGAALLSVICLAATVLAAPALFPGVPRPLIPQMRQALFIVGIGMAVELLSSAWSGVFIGLERFEVPALAVGGTRVMSAGGLIVAALAGRSLIVMAAIIASANLLSYLIQFAALRNIAPDVRFRPSLVQRSTARELYGYCLGLTIMSLSTLLVTGFDLVLVGHFQFSAVIPYSVAASVITFVAGLLLAGLNVLMPHAVTLHASNKPEELGRLLITVTRASVLILVLTGLPLEFFSGAIMHLWIGQRYVASGRPLLTLLIVANIIRLIGAPYAIILVAAGQQSFIKISPLAEGISNFIASVLFAIPLGGVGVACGTLLGSLVSVVSHLFYSMPRTRLAIAFSRRRFLASGVVSPLLWTSPLLGVAAYSWSGTTVRPAVFAIAMLSSCVGAAFLLYRTSSTKGKINHETLRTT